ncbi:MAG: hypothetical protein LBB64_05920, partial [Dysgonamonadaceae bacterium]|nr:hypothetical protein [Dysgonamonadaceae bacterium]
MNKKQVSQLIVSLFIIALSACTDQRYDLDDDKVDKSVVFSPDGINIPIGQIDKISIDNELKKLYTSDQNPIQVDENGILYMEYAGEIPFEFPEFQALTVSSVNTTPTDLQNIPAGTGIIPKGKWPLLDNGLASYTIEKPLLTNEQENLQIRVDKIYFS